MVCLVSTEEAFEDISRLHSSTCERALQNFVSNRNAKDGFCNFVALMRNISEEGVGDGLIKLALP